MILKIKPNWILFVPELNLGVSMSSFRSFIGLLVASLLLSVSAFAEALKISDSSGGYWIHYQADNHTFLDRIETDSRGWPYLKSHEVFRSKAAFKYAANNRGLFSNEKISDLAFSENPNSDDALAVELQDKGTTPLWKVTQTWSFEWELKYAEWVEKNIDKEFFVRTKQKSDCADLAYIARWIFARENGLPAANRLAGSGVYFTQNSVKSEWMSLPTDKDWTKDRRFRAALDYLLLLTYTHSLMQDSYPIAIEPAIFKSGIHHLILDSKSGHNILIHRTDYANPATLPFIVLYSTLPVQIRSLAEENYFYIEQPKVNKGGFLRMRWPVFKGNKVSLVAAEQMPGYSLEQYGEEIMTDQSSFGVAVMRKLKPTFSFVTALNAALDGIKSMLNQRITLVEDGYAVCSKSPCAPDSINYEDWSTPSRDARILAQIKLAISMGSLGNLDEQKQTELILKREFAAPIITLEGNPISLKLIYESFRRGLFSSDPNLSPRLRWGVLPEAIAEIFKTRADKLILEREKFITNSGKSCLGNTSNSCLPGSEIYLKETSGPLDTQLKELANLRRVYCVTTGTESAFCSTLNKILSETTVTFLDRKISLSAALDAFLNLNSDPRVAMSRRNGTDFAGYSKLEITGSREFRLAGKTAFVRRKTDLIGQILDRQGQEWKPRVLGSGVRIYDVNFKSKVGLYSNGGELYLGDLSGKRAESIFKTAEPIEATLVSNSRVFVRSLDEWKLLERISEGNWKILLSAQYTARSDEPKFERELNLYRTGDDPESNWSVVDLMAKTPKIFSFDGFPLSDDGRPQMIGKNSAWIQVIENPGSEAVMRTYRLDRAAGTLSSVAGIKGYVAHVTGNEKTIYFSDKEGAITWFYSAPLSEKGEIGAREKISTDFYRQADFIIFYGGIENMLKYAVIPSGELVLIKEQDDEEWMKHIRGNFMIVLLKDGRYGIRKVGETKHIHVDGMLAFPHQAGDETELRFLVRTWKGGKSDQVYLTDEQHPERFAALTGDLFGDSFMSFFEPWSVDSYRDMGLIQIDRGAILNFGSQVFWIGDAD
jgi:hypothetical protein